MFTFGNIELSKKQNSQGLKAWYEERGGDYRENLFDMEKPNVHPLIKLFFRMRLTVIYRILI